MAIRSAILIDPRTGIVSVGDVMQIMPFETQSEIAPRVAEWLQRSRDHGNGYAWLTLTGLEFGGRSAVLRLGFHDERLAQFDWSVSLSDAPLEGEMPAREAIDNEIAFVRNTLGRQGIALRVGQARMPWGEVWSMFDAKGGFASNGVRYRQT